MSMSTAFAATMARGCLLFHFWPSLPAGYHPSSLHPLQPRLPILAHLIILNLVHVADALVGRGGGQILFPQCRQRDAS